MHKRKCGSRLRQEEILLNCWSLDVQGLKLTTGLGVLHIIQLILTNLVFNKSQPCVITWTFAFDCFQMTPCSLTDRLSIQRKHTGGEEGPT